MRFRGDEVTLYDSVDLSMAVPLANGNFNYAYVPFLPDVPAFDAQCLRLIEVAKSKIGLEANAGERDDLAYLSCMPWLDYTAINNALPGPEDCIPRVSWGKFVADGNGRRSMAMTIEMHHALVDGRQVGEYFRGVQTALNGSLFFQNLASLEYSPGLFTTGVYITAFLGGGATAVITVYGTTVAALTPLVEYTL
jgi:chloramphenicol O-acetyltransferase type A